VDAFPYVGILDPNQPTPVVVQPLGNVLTGGTYGFAAGTFSDL